MTECVGMTENRKIQLMISKYLRHVNYYEEERQIRNNLFTNVILINCTVLVYRRFKCMSNNSDDINYHAISIF